MLRWGPPGGLNPIDVPWGLRFSVSPVVWTWSSHHRSSGLTFGLGTKIPQAGHWGFLLSPLVSMVPYRCLVGVLLLLTYFLLIFIYVHLCFFTSPVSHMWPDREANVQGFWKFKCWITTEMQTEAGLKAVEPEATQEGKEWAHGWDGTAPDDRVYSVTNWEKSKWNALWFLYTGTKCWRHLKKLELSSSGKNRRQQAKKTGKMDGSQGANGWQLTLNLNGSFTNYDSCETCTVNILGVQEKLFFLFQYCHGNHLLKTLAIFCQRT